MNIKQTRKIGHEDPNPNIWPDTIIFKSNEKNVINVSFDIDANLHFWENYDSVENIIFMTSFSIGNELERNKDNKDGEKSMWKNLGVQNWWNQENFDLVTFDI